ncbi:MAG: hypothetical protein Q7S03_04025 [bacterium]|nr:hypothetical protein [bacterium]
MKQGTFELVEPPAWVTQEEKAFALQVVRELLARFAAADIPGRIGWDLKLIFSEKGTDRDLRFCFMLTLAGGALGFSKASLVARMRKKSHFVCGKSWISHPNNWYPHIEYVLQDNLSGEDPIEQEDHAYFNCDLTPEIVAESITKAVQSSLVKVFGWQLPGLGEEPLAVLA